MENDFLDGIDEHFERLMKESGNGNRNGSGSSRRSGRTSRSGGAGEDARARSLMAGWAELDDAEKDLVLDYIRTLKRQSDLF
jgi:hypothetical protein